MKLELETEIRLKIEAIKAIGQVNYDRLRDVRPDLSIIKIHQLIVASKKVSIPFNGISNAEYRYKNLHNPTSKSISDYCEQNRYIEIAEKKARYNHYKSLAIMRIKFTLLFAILIVITILASASR